MKALGIRTLFLAAAAAGCLALLPLVAASRAAGPAMREVKIVARDMAFYVDGQPDPNPTLRFQAGEQVRLVLRNEDAGMTHDFVIKAWQVATKSISYRGAEEAVVFRVPDDRSAAGYQCTPHSEMMRGGIRVD